MRDEYVGDIGDFGKYILLNELAKVGDGKIKIGINWYYNTEPEYGMFKYLFSRNYKEYKDLSEQLFNNLRKIVINKREGLATLHKSNGVKNIQADAIIPGVKKYYGRPVEVGVQRISWFDNSLIDLQDVDVIFLDPDNGIAPNTVNIEQGQAVKYVFMSEIKKYLASKKSLIIYNHRDRKAIDQFADTCSDLCAELERGCIIIKHVRYQTRYYVFVPTDTHMETFKLLSDKLTTEYKFLFKFDENLNRKIRSRLKDAIIWPD